MRFRLVDRKDKQVHEGVMPRLTVPDVVAWGNRVFGHPKLKDEIATFHEVEAYRIGLF
jgi:diadenosine tetraphosphatase ApaH/serine/threonine PP2A family protein phosphatase